MSNEIYPCDDEASCWRAAAPKLAEWAWSLPNRSDAWGKYIPVRKRRGQKKSFTAKGELSKAVFLEHFTGRTIIGLHSTAPDDETCSWLGLDFDQHADDDELGSKNEAFATALYNELVSGGYDVLLTDSNGAGGFHLRLFFPERLPAACVHDFGKYLLRNAAASGIGDVEKFPKQRKLTGKRFGNWLRLPGKHHTRDHWSRVWDGSRWLAGVPAIEHLLATNHGGVRSPVDDAGFLEWKEATEELANEEQRRKPIQSRTPMSQGSSDEEESIIRSALACIHPDEDYFQWLRIGIALNRWDTIRGLQIWHEWSSAGEKYNGQDLDSKWPGFGGGDVTLGTLFHIANRCGWVRPKPELPKIEIPEDTRREVSISEFREEMARNHAGHVMKNGVCCNTAPTGVGKSHLDQETIRDTSDNPYHGHVNDPSELHLRALLVLPTHENCSEVVRMMKEASIDAVAAPRLDESTCEKFDKANNIQERGISVAKAMCAGCELRDNCVYQEGLAAARAARVMVMTHKRLENEGFTDTGRDRVFAAIHEDATNVLRPTTVSRQSSFDQVANSVSDEESELFWDDPVLQWFRETAREIAEAAGGSLKIRKFRLPDGVHACNEAKSLQLLAAWTSKRTAKAVRILSDLMSKSGEVEIYDHHTQGKDPHRVVALVRHNKPRDDMSTILADATARGDRLEKLLGSRIPEIAPNLRIAYRHRTVQVPSKIKQSTSPNVVLNTLRGVFSKHPDKRIGVICWNRHKPFIEATGPMEWANSQGTVQVVEPLPPGEQQRITKIAHFGSGDERSSNQWKMNCDLIVILGTYRQHPNAVRDRLVQWGELDALKAGSSWEQYEWIGTNEDGESVVVQARRYSNPVWQEAYESLTLSVLHQCVGRGRGLNEDGIPVLVLSNEPLGLRLSSECTDSPEVNVSQRRLLSDLTNRAETLNKNTIRVPARSAAKLSESVNMPLRSVQAALQDLEANGLVVRTGKAKATFWHAQRRLSPGEQMILDAGHRRSVIRNVAAEGSLWKKYGRQGRGGAGVPEGGSTHRWSISDEASLTLIDQARSVFRESEC